MEGRPNHRAFYMCSTLIIILVSCFYLRSRAFAIRLYIRVRPIPMTLMILVIGTLLFNIVSALIRALIECSLRMGVLVPEADALVALLLKRIGGAEGALSSKLELELKGILYYSSSSSSLSLSELLAKESSGSDLSLDNLKSEKSNKISSIVRINR
jgi:hypothetical protein